MQKMSSKKWTILKLFYVLWERLAVSYDLTGESCSRSLSHYLYSIILHKVCQAKNALFRNFFHRNHTSATPIAPQQRPSIKSCSSYNIETTPFWVYIHSIHQSQGNVKHFLRKCVIFLQQAQKKSRNPANFNHIDFMFILTFYWFGFIWEYLGYYGLFFRT